MALFGFGKKNEEKKNLVRGCSDGESGIAASGCRAEIKGSEIRIKVLGAGCKSCREQYENAKRAVKDLGLSAEVEYITDMQRVMEYGVMSMPALVVNEEVVAMGRVLKAADTAALLRKLGF